MHHHEMKKMKFSVQEILNTHRLTLPSYILDSFFFNVLQSWKSGTNESTASLACSRS